MLQRQNYKKPAPRSVPNSVSTRFAIVIIDLGTMKEVNSSVRSHLDGREVTEEMVRQQVKDLNKYCGRHGLTARKILQRPTAFRLATLQ